MDWTNRINRKARFRLLLEQHKIERWLKQGRRVRDIDIARTLDIHPTRLARWQSLDEMEIPAEHQVNRLADFFSLSITERAELLQCLGYAQSPDRTDPARCHNSERE